MKMTKSSWNISSNYGRSKLTSLASLLTLALALCLPSSGMASLTVVDTGERYGSRVDHTYGRVFKRGFEYMARLQYLEGNFHLCPSNTKPQQVWNLTHVPLDFPVALLASTTGCSLKEKVEFARDYIYPKGVVKYLIVDNSRSGVLRSSSSELEEADTDEEEVEIFALTDDFDEDLSGLSDPAAIGMMHVSTNNLFKLRDLLIHQSPESRKIGGPRIVFDGDWGFGNRTVMMWLGVCALLSACACTFLLVIHNGSIFLFQEEAAGQNNQPPPRERRRRLTREQVRRMYPPYVFDGTGLTPHYTIHHPPPAPPSTELHEGPSSEGLLESTPPPPEVPRPCDLCDCSICLDDYEPGDKLRVLPCNHAFHYKCIGRWLAERSATCPLCKIELYDDEAEESSDEEAEEPGTAAPPGDMQPSSWQQLVNLLSFNIDGGHENLVTAAANQPQPEPRQQEGPVLQQPQQQPARDILSSEPSFWRRLLLRRRGRSRRTLAEQHGVTLNSGSLAEPLLQAENGQHDITTNGDEPSAEPPRPDPPEGGETEQETV